MSPRTPLSLVFLAACASAHPAPDPPAASASAARLDPRDQELALVEELAASLAMHKSSCANATRVLDRWYETHRRRLEELRGIPIDPAPGDDERLRARARRADDAVDRAEKNCVDDRAFAAALRRALPGRRPMAPPAPEEVREDATIGVAVCDLSLRDFEACAAKAPPEAQEAMRASLARMRAAWRLAADTGPAGRAGLETACEAAVDALRANPMCK